MIVVACDVLEADFQGVGRHSIASSLGPFDEDDRVAVDNIIPGKVREIIGTLQAVKVQVKDGYVFSMIFIHERESRTGHILAHSNTAADSLGKCRLAAAQVALKRHDGWRPELPTEVLSPRAKLVNREP